MNKIIIILLVLLAPVVVLSQNNKLTKLFKNCENQSEFSFTHGTSNSEISMGLDSDIEKLLNNVKQFYIVSYEGQESDDLQKFQGKLYSLTKKDKYKTLIEISGDGVFKVLLKRNSSNEPTDVVMIKEGENNYYYLYATI